MTIALDAGKFFVIVADIPGLVLPAAASDPRDVLVVVLLHVRLDPVGVGISVEHERVHGPGDFSLSLDLLVPLLWGSSDLDLHVLDWNVCQVRGRPAQRDYDRRIGAALGGASAGAGSFPRRPVEPGSGSCGTAAWRGSWWRC